MSAYVLIYSYYYFNKQDTVAQLISFSLITIAARVITLQNLTSDNKKQEKLEVS